MGNEGYYNTRENEVNFQNYIIILHKGYKLVYLILLKFKRKYLMLDSFIKEKNLKSNPYFIGI